MTLTYDYSISTSPSAPFPWRHSRGAACLRLAVQGAPVVIALASLLAAGLFVYLVYALVKPEKF